MDGTPTRSAIARLLAGATLAALIVPSGALGAVTGNVFRDYDADGVRDAREPGQGGVSVTAVGLSGQIATVQTNGAGDYALPVADATPVRIEVTAGATLTSGPRGSGASGLVQFVTAPAGGLSSGVAGASDYCEAEPEPRRELLHLRPLQCAELGQPDAGGSQVAARGRGRRRKCPRRRPYPRDPGAGRSGVGPGLAADRLGPG